MPELPNGKCENEEYASAFYKKEGFLLNIFKKRIVFIGYLK